MTPTNGNKPLEDFVDPKGYWADPECNIRRMSGEQDAILKATDRCTEAEWKFVLECMGMGGDEEGFRQ
jgi:hypothetical protein